MGRSPFRTGLYEGWVSARMQLHLHKRQPLMCEPPFAGMAGTCACCLHKWSCVCPYRSHKPFPLTPAGLPSRKGWGPLVHNKQRLTEECVTEFAYTTHPGLALNKGKGGWDGSPEHSNKILGLRNVYTLNEE